MGFITVLKLGFIEILKGNISGQNYGIYNTGDGVINIGVKGDGVPSISEPSIEGEEYGIFNTYGTINFYDGIIKGMKRWNIGTVSEIETGYKLEEENIGEYNCIYLIKESDSKNIARLESTGTEYSTLQEAIQNAKDNNVETITILEDFDLNYGTVVFDTDKNIKLDLNGKVITNNKVKVENRGKLEIIDSIGEGKINTIDTAIGILNSETGELIINGGSVTNEVSYNGTRNISYGIYNTKGKIKLGEGIIVAYYGIYNNSGTTTVEGGVINSDAYGIYNANGTVEVISGDIEGGNSGIHQTSGNVKINGGNIDGYYAIWNEDTNGTIEINNGKIIGSFFGIFNESGTNLKVTGGIISGRLGIYNKGTGTIEITGGNVKGSDRNGIDNASATIIIGTKGDGIVNKEEPNIKGVYGISSKGTLYFYDGRIEGSTTALTTSTKITEIEENTTQNYEDNDKILTLATEPMDLAQIGNNTYSSLQEAINAAGTNKTTIKLLRGVRYTNTDTSLTIANGQNITLDLNGKTIISAFEATPFINEGTFEIIDTSEGKRGKITTNEVNVTIQNNQEAILTITEGNIENTKISQSTINNEGTLNINGGNVSGITNNGVLNINGGTTSEIINKGIGTLNLRDGTIDYTITNQEQAKIEMTGGKIISSDYGIYNTSGNGVNITGGTILITPTIKNNYNAYGIYSTNGEVVIGVKDQNLITDPIITATTNAINIASGLLKYYDGTLKGEMAISGKVEEIERNSEILVETNETDQTVILQEISTATAMANGVEYETLKQAIDSIDMTGEIQIIRDGTISETTEIPYKKNITIDMNGKTLTTYQPIQNNGTLTITDNSDGATGILSTYQDSPIYNNGTLTIENGNISGNTYGIYNQAGTATVVGGNITNNTYGLYSSGGTINVTGGNIQNNQYGTFTYGGTINISQGNFSGNEYGVYNSSGTTNITGITLNGNTNNIYNGGSGTINIPNGNIITTDNTAIENASTGTIVIGEEGGTPSKESPLIQAEEYAIKNTGSGAIKFYDGIIKGRTGALQGLYLYKETGYAVKTDYIDGYYCDTLIPSGTVTTVAKIGNVEYSNLQSAINACTSQEETTIQLVNSISTDSTFQIEEGQNVVIDLNGKTITTSTAQTLINNAGTLKIIDTNSSQTGKITNETYNAIENSGTLTLGVDDGTVSTTCPEITGKAKAIINTGTLNFYDGIIKGATALEGTAISGKPSGYIMVKTREETTGYEVITLSV